jgi:hypothetical protein
MKLFGHTFFVLCCCLFYSSGLFAQAHHYVHYTTRDGLAGATLYTITQDSEGFMWFATETGLSRFDGRNFKNFTVEDGLPSNEVFGFYEDRRKRLWIKSFGNSPCYYYKGKIHNPVNTPELSPLVLKSYIRAIAESKGGEIIFTDEEGNTAILDKTGKVQKYDSGQYVIAQEAVINGHLNIPTVQLSGTLKAVADQYPREQKAFVRNATIADSTIFIQLSHEPQRNREVLLWYNKNATPKLIVRPERLHSVLLRGDSLLEAYRTGGAALYNLRTGKRSTLFLPDLIVNGVYQDRDRNIWFGTKWNGVYKLGNRDIINLSLTTKSGSQAIRFVHAGNGTLFAGDDQATLNSLSLADLFRNGKIPEKRERHETVAWLKNNAPQRCIQYYGSDFLHFNYKGKSHGVKSLFLSGDTVLVAAADCTFFTTLDNLSQVTPVYEGRSTCAVKYNNCYYVGTLNGLFIYNAAGQLLSTPLGNRISHFAIGQQGEIWVSTYDKGLYALSGQRVTKSLNKENSLLSSNLVHCIFYRDNTIWAGTDKGIDKINTSGTTGFISSSYNQNNGLNADMINSIFVDSANVYAGTAAGLSIFSRRLRISDTTFNLVFTGITVADTLTDFDQQISLPHYNNGITFDFSGISFSTNKITYRYRLTGLSDRWKETNEPSVSFLSLPSGKYNIQIQAIHPNGHKSHILEKAFTVQQSVWEYWWVRVLSALLAAVVLSSLVYLRIRKIRKTEADKREAVQQMAELEQMALRAQMNPHFIFNCLNSVQLYILKQDAAGANNYLSAFAGLVRQTLENSSKPLITLQEEMTYLKHYIELERLQVNFPFTYEITMDKTIVTSGILVPNMIIQPFIENALKHGLKEKQDKGHLAMDIRREEDALVWTITDNGPGINRAKAKTGTEQTHQSKGIALIEKRISTLNAMRPGSRKISVQITDLQESGRQGTSVVVTLPLIVNTHPNH